ncbi:MAG: hypothetical protein CSA65_08585 [Proteobacteria bacterium]|nr:MAG: hypothetical protein CSA65_08585 [Pseudomonadota bacterium]
MRTPKTLPIPALAALLALGSACSGFSRVQADASPDVPTLDSAPDLGRGLEADLGGIPNDFPCGKDYWANAIKSDPNCNPRRVVLIDEGLPQGEYDEELWTVFGLSLALSEGKLGVAFDNRYSAEEGHLRLLSFPAGTTEKVPVSSVELISGLPYHHYGYAVDLITAKKGGYHLAYAEVGAFGGQLGVRRWSGHGKPEPFELVSTEVDRHAKVRLVEADDDQLHAIVYEDKAKRLLWSRRAPGGAWSTPSYLLKMSTTVTGAGQLAAHRHAGGHPAFVLHYGSGLGSQPLFKRWDPTSGWSGKTTLDNNTLDGLAGYSPALVITPRENHAAYFTAGVSDTKAELWVASWSGLGAVTHQRVLEKILHDARSPQYALAMDVDQWGLLHLVVAVPSIQAPSGTIEYWRQQLVAGKETWIYDVIESDVISDSISRTHVAIVVEPQGKPHIVYYNGKHMRLMYATRDDR